MRHENRARPCLRPQALNPPRPDRLRLPLIESLAHYRLGWLRNDISAGLAIAAVGLPSAIAYPAIAGLPPQVGLYASIAPLVGYALFGSSRQLIVGPDAATMTVLAAVLATVLAALPAPQPGDRVAAAALLALMVGGFCLAARLLRLGVIASFLSRPILVGFFAGISLSILVGQIGRFTGVSIDANGLVAPFIELAGKIDAIHLPSLALGLAMFVLLQVMQATRLPVPGPVVVVVLSVILSAALDFEGRGIAVVGDIPAGLPAIAVPALSALPIHELVLGALAVFLVSFGAGIITARSFGARGNYRVDPNGELVGFGAANIASGFFGGFPITASDSRTAVNMSVGGKTQVASLVSAAALIATLLYLNGALRILPIPALGAILAAAALSLIDLDSLRQIWRISRLEFAFALIAMWGAISLGALEGVMIAVAATFASLLSKGMFPRDAMLGRIPGRDGFYKLHRSKDARPVPGLAVCLIEGSLLFFSVDHVKERLAAIADDLPPDTRWFVLDASAIVQVDSTAAAMLEEFRADLARRGISLGIAELHSPARALLERAGVLARIGPTMIFDDLEEVMLAIQAQT